MNWERILGRVLIVALASMALNQAMDAIIAHPNWYGLSLVASSAWIGVLAVRSIYRDRVR